MPCTLAPRLQCTEQELEDGIATGMMSGLASGLASGIASSLPSGIETPDTMLNLRKASESEQPRQLYQVRGGARCGARVGRRGKHAPCIAALMFTN